jgi:hypothetical protein
MVLMTRFGFSQQLKGSSSHRNLSFSCDKRMQMEYSKVREHDIVPFVAVAAIDASADVCDGIVHL